MNKENCALKLVDEIILCHDASFTFNSSFRFVSGEYLSRLFGYMIISVLSMKEYKFKHYLIQVCAT